MVRFGSEHGFSLKIFCDMVKWLSTYHALVPTEAEKNTGGEVELC